MFQNIGEILLLLWRTFCSLPQLWCQRKKVFEQLFEIGNRSLLMACILSIFIGGVVSLQSGPVLAERGIANALGGLVGISLAKELSPVMMAVLIAGRIGSAMAAGLLTAWRLVAKNPDGTPLFAISIDLQLFMWAAIIATLTGLAAAVTPAFRAARLQPVEAIRG